MIRLMVEEDLSMLMAMYMKDNGLMIRHMEKEYISTLTGQCILETGFKMYSMGMGCKNLWTVLHTKGTFLFK